MSPRRQKRGNVPRQQNKSVGYILRFTCCRVLFAPQTVGDASFTTRWLGLTASAQLLGLNQNIHSSVSLLLRRLNERPFRILHAFVNASKRTRRITMPPQPSESSILKSLNKAQSRAVTSQASTVAILAGPGSGKTHTLTSRVVWLIQHAGYRPQDVIVATFTVKAAREMKERIGKALGEEIQNKIVLGTFHSISRRYLATYGKRIGLNSKFGIADDGDSKAIIQRICKRFDLKVEPSHAKSWISKQKAKGSNAASSQPQKGQAQTQHKDLLKCAEEYQEHLIRANLLDYDDLLVRCAELLREHPSCVSNVQTVLIDEYQDTNGIQYELMGLFAQRTRRITVVGDPDQSIYGWRSAEVRNLYRLLRDYPNTDEISLEENYRSSQSILDISLRVIQEDKKRYQKVLLPVHAKGTKPVLRSLSSSSAESEWIIMEIRRLIVMFGGMLKYNDVAILLRSASLSRHIESALGKAGIAYRMIGGHKFYERKEIKILIDYLRVVNEPSNNDAVARIMNVPRRGIGEATIKSLLEEAEANKMSLWAVICQHCRGERKSSTNIRSNMEQKLNTGLIRVVSSLQHRSEEITESSPVTLTDLVEQLISQLKFKQYLEDEYTDNHESRWSNVQEFVNLVRDFMRDFASQNDDELPMVQGLEQTKDTNILGRFLANISLASDAQRGDDVQDPTALVTISTIHAAKGLEWPIVIVPSVYNGSIPHARSEDSDEERRLLYVAMTRAQALLYLSCPLYGSQGFSHKVELSHFISSFASKAFAQKGPVLNSAVLSEVAKILGRELVTERVAVKGLPPTFSPEDDTFPIEPVDPKNADNVHGSGHNQTSKRKLEKIPQEGSAGEDEDRPWKREYHTTMEQAADFTMSSLPGFVSAGRHQSTLVAADDVRAKEKVAMEKPDIKKSTTRRPADQKSLLGFVKREQGLVSNNTNRGNLPSSRARHDFAMSRHADRVAKAMAESTRIDPVLAKHGVAKGNMLERKIMPKPPEDVHSNQYACFSSSPPRPPSPAQSIEPAKDSHDDAGRPAQTLHATTFTSVASKPGFRRPVGMGPAPTMDRLRKPFKPLTITRPGGPPRG